MAIYRDEVTILKSRNLGEFDKLLTFFGKRRGKFRVIAKGVRKISSRKRGHLETFNLCRVSCAEGKNLDIVVEAESLFSLDSEKIESSEFERLGFAGLVMDKFMPEEVPDSKVYDLWGKYIRSNHGLDLTVSFVVEILDISGFISEKQKSQWAGTASESSWDQLRRLVGQLLNEI